MGKLERRLQVISSSGAQALVAILTRLGYSCALCGDIAAYSFGAPRSPQKVDAFIFAPAAQGPWEHIDVVKNIIAQNVGGLSGFFFTKNTHSGPVTLCYRDHTTHGKKLVTCVVDIEYLDTTAVHLIRDIDGLPYAPISYVLLRKLEDWETSFAQLSLWPRRDAVDAVHALLTQVSNIDIKELNEEALCPALYSESRERVRKYISMYPESAGVWVKLGFENPLTVSSPPSPPFVQGVVPKMPEMSEPLIIENPSRLQMVLLAANTAVIVLRKCGWASVVFGGLACFMYGNARSPNDVDILVLPPPASAITPEELKQELVMYDPYHFFTTAARDPSATYRVLYYRLTNAPAQTARTSCKVDILLPGLMHLPHVPPPLIFWDEGLPLVPFALLLLHKLQAMDDHRNAAVWHKRQKQQTDVQDVEGLLALSVCVPLVFSRPWSDRQLFSEEFETRTRRRVREFCFAYPEYAQAWDSLGFET
ncbi:hypothetical protein D9615_009030 [Tricholomella constricta]|uniref:Uncharacterized protein n=1 Tax=Tricholomella constricta TaxID=117010 RepID=A0A8H5H173_9AGAR|nr:hypothetical protein D9615_009030 [Tricholomella constricta]